MKKIAIFTGAGVSQESGVDTFRQGGSNPLWANYDVEKVATLEGWKKDKQMVTDFYNGRRVEMGTVEPNEAHKQLARLEDKFDVTVVTQNIDDLHERGGSSTVYKLHGDLRTVRSEVNPMEKYDWEYKEVDLKNDRGKNNACLRPHVVWFGEYPDVEAVTKGGDAIIEADILIIVGTSLQIGYTPSMLGKTNASEIYFIDPEPVKYLDAYGKAITYIEEKAVKGVSDLVEILMNR